jgi:sterol 3beta-glucosyltransferase
MRSMDCYPVFIDFGSLSFREAPLPWAADDDMSKIQEKSIRGALSLDSGESQLWSESITGCQFTKYLSLCSVVRSRIYRSVSSSGFLVVSPHFVCFWSKSLSPCDIKHRFPVSTIKSVKPINVTFSRPNGLVLEIKGGFSLKLVFRTQECRDDAITLISGLNNGSHMPSSPSGTIIPSATLSLSESPTKSMKTNATGIIAPLSRSLAAAATVNFPTTVQIRLPKAINLPHDVLHSMPPMHFVCLTIGSRGDVQPYIALGLGLKKEGHRVTIATHEEYKNWIQGFGIEHRTTGGDPGALMKLSVEHRVCCIFSGVDIFSEMFCLFRCFLPNFSRRVFQK